MRFKPSQVLGFIGISFETLRHWKKALPPIASKDGRTDDYTFAELLSLALIARVTQAFSVQVSLFTDFSTELFDQLQELVDREAYSKTLFIDRNRAGLVDPDDLPSSEAMIVVQIEPVARELLAKIGASNEPSDQLTLPLLRQAG